MRVLFSFLGLFICRRIYFYFRDEIISLFSFCLFEEFIKFYSEFYFYRIINDFKKFYNN